MRLLADRSGLTKELSKATARRSFLPVHDRGRVLVDVAVMLADGGEAIGDINVLRHQDQVLGPVASAPTVWRPGRADPCGVEADRGGTLKSRISMATSIGFTDNSIGSDCLLRSERHGIL